MRRSIVILTALVVCVGATAWAQNLVSNGDFDTDTSGWTVNAPSGLTFLWTDLDAGGSSTSGSGLATTTLTGSSMTISQCVATGIVGGATYDFATKMRVSSWGVHGSSEVTLNWLSGSSCTGTYTGTKGYTTAALDEWVSLGQADLTAPAGSSSAQIVLRLHKDAVGSTFQTYFDDIELISHAPATATQQLFLPVAAAKHGVAPTYWSTNGWFANPTTASVTLSGAFLRPNVDNSTAVASPAPLATIPAGGFLELEDLVAQLGGHEETGGVYLFASAADNVAAPLVVGTSYTFTPNEQGPGFYGQGIPASGAGSKGDVVVAGVFQDAIHRTNVGALNTSSGSVVIAITVSNADGVQVGSGTWTLLPYAHIQVSVGTLGVTTVDGGVVTFHRTSGLGSFLAYASTVDQQTGDAVYNPAQ
jgi:hypothetical protein